VNRTLLTEKSLHVLFLDCDELFLHDEVIAFPPSLDFGSHFRYPLSSRVECTDSITGVKLVYHRKMTSGILRSMTRNRDVDPKGQQDYRTSEQKSRKRSDVDSICLTCSCRPVSCHWHRWRERTILSFICSAYRGIDCTRVLVKQGQMAWNFKDFWKPCQK
jgi:hypothetical protein